METKTTPPHWIRAVSLLLSVIFFSGCVSNQTYPPKTPEQLLAKTKWQAKGKIGIRQDGKAHSAYFDWQNHNQNYVIRISGALGVGGAKLEKQAGNIILTTKKDTLRAHSAEALLDQSLGWSMPVSDLSFWIKGLAAPSLSADQHEIGDNGELLSLEQAGWQINYSDYSSVKGYQLPGKIKAQRDNIKITLIVKNWKI